MTETIFDSKDINVKHLIGGRLILEEEAKKKK
jgi:hypothetical protein